MKTWKEVENYLICNIENANEQKSKANPLFTKSQMWDLYMSQCSDNIGELPIRTAHILIANIKKDFQ